MLKEVEQFQLTDSDKPKPPPTSTMTTDKKRPTRWPIVTLANVKALAFSSRPSTSAGSRVHCEFPSLSSSHASNPPLRISKRQQERYAPSRQPFVTADDDSGKRREVFVSSIAHQSNQSEQLETAAASRDRLTVRRPAGQGDKMLRYHVKLAHSWNPPPPR